MFDIDFKLFNNESEIMENISEMCVDSYATLAVCPIGAYQIKIFSPGVALEDYFYKVFLIKNSDILGISYFYTEQPIPPDFPEEYREMINDSVQDYYKSALMNPCDKSDINHSLYDSDSDSCDEEDNLYAQPLLFSYNRQIQEIEPPEPNNEVEISENSITYYSISP